MAARGRQPGFKMSDSHRVKIQNSNILNALLEHVEGKREMSSTQVTTGIALMKKVLPDLSAITLEGGENPIKTEEVGSGAAKLAAYLDAISQRTASDSTEE